MGDGEEADGLGVNLEWPSDRSEGEPDITPFVPPPVEQALDADLDADLDALPPVTRHDSVQAGVVALSMRVDALLTATTSYRSLITDRISEYAEGVSRQSRSQAAALEEYRHETDRVVAELRRSVSDAEEVMHRLAGRVDELVGDVGNLADLSRSSIVEGRDFAASVDKITRSVRDGLDGFTTRVLERLDQVRSGLETELAAVRTDGGRLRQSVADAAAAWNADRAEASVESLRDDLAGLRSVVLEWPELGEMRDDVRALADRALDSGAGTADEMLVEEITALREEVRTIGASVGAMDDRPAVAGVGPLVEELVAVREEVAALRRRIAVRSKGDSVSLDETQLTAIVDAVASRLADTFEVVEDTPPKQPARARSPRAKRT